MEKEAVTTDPRGTMSDNKVIEMIKCAETGDSEKLKSLIEAGADVNGTGEDGYTALIKAAKSGHHGCVSVLIQSGAHVNTAVTSVEIKTHNATNDKVKALIEALEKGHEKCVGALLEAGADVTFVSHSCRYERTVLINAAEKGHSKCVKLLLKMGKYSKNDDDEDDDNKEKEDDEEDDDDTDGPSPNAISAALIAAAGNGHCECVQSLVKAGADINAEDEEGNTPLINAAENGCEKCVKILIDEGADVNISTMKRGNIMEVDEEESNSVTPVFAAANRGHDSCLKLAIQAGADVNSTDALPRAALFGYIECMKLLIEAGAYVNKPDDLFDGEPMFHAATEANDDCVDLLLKAGADVKAACSSHSNFHGQTALSLGSHYSRAPFNTYEDDSKEMLKARLRIVKSLLRAGAPVNVKNDDGQTALEYKIVGSSLTIGDKRDKLNKIMIMLLFAAGDTIDGTGVGVGDWFRIMFPQDLFTNVVVPIPRYIKRLRKTNLCLKDMCRKTIRKLLMLVNPNANLFVTVPALNLPDLLSDYLLYNMSLDDEIEEKEIDDDDGDDGDDDIDDDNDENEEEEEDKDDDD